MSIARLGLTALSLTALVLVSGCALTKKGTPVFVRYFTPEHPPAEGTTSSPATGPEVRLGRVTSGSDLGERIVHGDGAYEVGFYDSRRWTEIPEKYVRSALERALFDEGGFRRSVGGNAPTLNVEVLSFMEVKNAQTHLARVALRGMLSTDHELFAETFAVDQPVDGIRFEDVVAATSHALDSACQQIAIRVGAALAKPPGSVRNGW